MQTMVLILDTPEIPNRIEVPRAEEFVKDIATIIKNLKKNLESAIKKQEIYANKHLIKPPEIKKTIKYE